MVNSTTWDVQCCAFGSVCDSPCDETEYLVNYTSTITSGTSTSTSIGYGCAPRACTSTNYLCAEEFGGGCCPFGATCASDKQCLSPSTISTPIKTVASEIPVGCTAATQHSCASSLGGGCCADTEVCTIVSSTSTVCSSTGLATATASPTPSGVTTVHQDSGGISTGAKAGIAIGIVVVAAIIIGALTWWCIRRRRDDRSRRQSTAGGSRNLEMQSASGAGGLHPYSAHSGPHMSEGRASSTQMSRPGPLRGLSSEYFGPDAETGPYTDHSTATTPPSFFMSRAVPSDPHGPDDIAVPVEIGHGGSVKRKDLPHRLSHTSTPGSVPNVDVQHASPAHNSIAGRFELHGTEVERSPAHEGGLAHELGSNDGDDSREEHHSIRGRAK